MGLILVALITGLLSLTSSAASAPLDTCNENFSLLTRNEISSDLRNALDLCNQLTSSVNNVEAAYVNHSRGITIWPRTWQEPYLSKLKTDLCRAAKRKGIEVVFTIPSATDFLVAVVKSKTEPLNPLEAIVDCNPPSRRASANRCRENFRSLSSEDVSDELRSAFEVCDVVTSIVNNVKAAYVNGRTQITIEPNVLEGSSISKLKSDLCKAVGGKTMTFQIPLSTPSLENWRVADYSSHAEREWTGPSDPTKAWAVCNAS